MSTVVLAASTSGIYSLAAGLAGRPSQQVPKGDYDIWPASLGICVRWGYEICVCWEKGAEKAKVKKIGPYEATIEKQ